MEEIIELVKTKIQEAAGEIFSNNRLTQKQKENKWESIILQLQENPVLPANEIVVGSQFNPFSPYRSIFGSTTNFSDGGGYETYPIMKGTRKGGVFFPKTYIRNERQSTNLLCVELHTDNYTPKNRGTDALGWIEACKVKKRFCAANLDRYEKDENGEYYREAKPHYFDGGRSEKKKYFTFSKETPKNRIGDIIELENGIRMFHNSLLMFEEHPRQKDRYLVICPSMGANPIVSIINSYAKP